MPHKAIHEADVARPACTCRLPAVHPTNANSAAASVLRMQRTHGNRSVQRMLAIARQQADTEVATADIESTIEQSRGGGQPLEHGVRVQMERAFGADFTAVRAHGDARADTLSRSLGAVAFTTGRDIFFRSGAYNPNSGEGRHLLAHELAHVVQQNSAPGAHGDAGGAQAQRLCAECEEEARLKIHPKLTVSQPQDADELEADAVATRVTALLDTETAAPDAAPRGNTSAGAQLAVLRRGLRRARVEHADAAALLERSMDALTARPDHPFFALSPHPSSTACPSCHASRRVDETHHHSPIQRVVTPNRIARQGTTRRTPTQCINNALASAGIPWATLAILGAVCGGIGAIAGLAGGPAAPATSPSAAAVAIAFCWAGVTGLTVGFILGVIIDCINNPDGDWIFAQAPRGGAAGGGGAVVA